MITLLVITLLAAIWAVLFVVAYLVLYFREEKMKEKSYGEGWEVGYRDIGGYYSCQTPPIDYATNDSTDYIY